MSKQTSWTRVQRLHVGVQVTFCATMCVSSGLLGHSNLATAAAESECPSSCLDTHIIAGVRVQGDRLTEFSWPRIFHGVLAEICVASPSSGFPQGARARARARTREGRRFSRRIQEEEDPSTIGHERTETNRPRSKLETRRKNTPAPPPGWPGSARSPEVRTTHGTTPSGAL